METNKSQYLVKGFCGTGLWLLHENAAGGKLTDGTVSSDKENDSNFVELSPHKKLCMAIRNTIVPNPSEEMRKSWQIRRSISESKLVKGRSYQLLKWQKDCFKKLKIEMQRRRIKIQTRFINKQLVFEEPDEREPDVKLMWCTYKGKKIDVWLLQGVIQENNFGVGSGKTIA